MKLPLKLAILVIAAFGLLVTGMVLWKPMKVRYYTAKLYSNDIKVRQYAAEILLDMGEKELAFERYAELYALPDVKMRMEIVDELCAVDKGMMKEIFRNHVYSEQVRIQAGMLALPNGSRAEIPSLYVDKYEVTYEKWWVYLAVSEYKLSDVPSGTQKYRWARVLENADLPVGYITGAEAKAYAELFGMRLPTEYEWEYVARAGSTGMFCLGDDRSLLDEYAWFKDNAFGKPHPVGEKRANKWGLYDMQGNVLEVVSYNDSTIRVKGGCYSQDLWTVKTFIGWPWSSRGLNDMGFRCVRDAK